MGCDKEDTGNLVYKTLTICEVITTERECSGNPLPYDSLSDHRRDQLGVTSMSRPVEVSYYLLASAYVAVSTNTTDSV